MNELTVEELRDRMAAIERQLAASTRQQAEMNAIVILLMRRWGDPTHFSIEDTARITNVSTKTVRRKIRSGEYRLELKPGTRFKGIPVEQVFGGWLSVTAARTAVDKAGEKNG